MSELHPLGRHVEHDPRSRNFALPESSEPLKRVLWRRYGGPFDQGQIGSCTGNAIAGVLNTAPFHKSNTTLLLEADALKLYELATTLDSVPGQYPPDDTGSSGLAACKAAQQLGYIKSYYHAFSLNAALQALMSGPVITGVNWYSSFDTPGGNGVVAIGGYVRGGHEFEVLGFNPTTGLLTAENSWGSGWGLKGRFKFTMATWGQLLSEQGDVTVPSMV